MYRYHIISYYIILYYIESPSSARKFSPVPGRCGTAFESRLLAALCIAAAGDTGVCEKKTLLRRNVSMGR